MWRDRHLLDCSWQQRYTTSLNRAEDEQREIGCLTVNAVARDVHNEIECAHEALLLMQSRRQACAAHDSVSALRVKAEHTSCARTERERVRVDRCVAEKTVTSCVSAEIPQRVSDSDAWRRVSHCREPQCHLSRSEQEKITSEEAKPEEIKSMKSARDMSQSMQGNVDEGESFVSSIGACTWAECPTSMRRSSTRNDRCRDQVCRAVELRRN